MDTLIVDPDSVLLPQIANLSDVKIKRAVQQQSFKILVVIYQKLYSAVADPKNNYAPNLLALTPDKLEESLCGGPSD